MNYAQASIMRDRAQRSCQMAVKRGELQAASGQICVDCGAAATEYDHRSYAKPLDVVAVCHRCNITRGPSVEFGGEPDAKGRPGGAAFFRQLLARGLSMADIARRHNISRQAVRCALKGGQ